MSSELARKLQFAAERRVPSGRDVAPLLRDSARLIPFLSRYLAHADPAYRFVAADALFRISRSNRPLIARNVEAILRGLKFQDLRTRTRILQTVAPIVREYPMHVERYLATISHCLYNPDAPALRHAASVCLGHLAAIDERRSALYIPMLLQCIGKYRAAPETWRIIRSLALPLRGDHARRYHRRIREVILPFRNKGAQTRRRAVRRVLAMTLG